MNVEEKLKELILANYKAFERLLLQPVSLILPLTTFSSAESVEQP